jgi:hypothetical protein
MSPEVRARAFDAFFTTKSRGLGTGLGLSLVRSVVTAAGGEIDIETAAGKGTEIVLTFPAAHDHEHGCGESDHKAAVYLLDRRAASMAAHILESAGWHVTRTDEPAPPISSGSTIWVTESDERALKAAKAYANGPSATGRVIVSVGQPRSRAPWVQLRAIFVENARDFDALRNAIGRAIASVTGAHR